jgi:hypothetical protein
MIILLDILAVVMIAYLIIVVLLITIEIIKLLKQRQNSEIPEIFYKKS